MLGKTLVEEVGAKDDVGATLGDRDDLEEGATLKVAVVSVSVGAELVPVGIADELLEVGFKDVNRALGARDA